MTREWCPQCQCVQNTTMSITKLIEKDKFGNNVKKVSKSYECSICHVFIRSEIQKEESTAFCGLICLDCPIYLATKANDEEQKAKLAADYSTETCKFTKDDMTCKGCHEKEGFSEKMCKECPIRKCGLEKNILHCAECPDYPCEHIETLAPKGKPNRDYLDALR